MKILYIHKAFYDKRPPMINTVENILMLGHTLILVTSGIKEDTKKNLEKRNVIVVDIGAMPEGRFKKVFYYLKYRKIVRQLIKKHSDYLFWIASLDAAIAIGKSLVKTKYILQIQELYDKKPTYLRLLKKFINSSVLNIVPDNGRALIFRSWYNLKTTPYVLPNKPLISTVSKNKNIIDEPLMVSNKNNKELLEKIKSKKLVLYQATMIRMDLFDIAQALLELGDDYILGLFGGIRDKVKVDKLLSQYPNVVYFEYMPAPSHLEMTSNAWLGILTYNYESLNNVFCAPNKTWEYSAFGVPMLANNLPLLRLQLEKYNAGLTYEFSDIESIKNAIIAIDKKYNEFKHGSVNLYNSENMSEHISEILKISNKDENK